MSDMYKFADRMLSELKRIKRVGTPKEITDSYKEQIINYIRKELSKI